MTRVGFVGAGRIGAPMVQRLVKAGHEVHALGRTPEKCAAVQGLGAQAVTDLAEAGREADVVVVCVFTDRQVRQVCLDSDLMSAMQPGSVLVVHTTASPLTMEAIAARADRRFIDVVDAPVSGGPHDVSAGVVTLFVGGADETVAQVRPLLSCYGDPVLHVGPAGTGQRVKLLNNTLFAAQIGIVAEALRVGAELGVDEPTLLRALPHGSATSSALSKIAAAGSAEKFIAFVGDFLDKDVALVREALTELDTDMGDLDRLIDNGLQTGTRRRMK